MKDFGVQGWATLASKEERARWYCERLEDGEILFFAHTPFLLPNWEFPPNSTWIVFTDMAPHAALSGRFALEQTFLVPRDALLLPKKAPVQILEELSGAPLTN